MSSPAPSSQAPDTDPFDSLLHLESQFFSEGYNLGLTDGHRAGQLEGRAFGLENGFEKFVAMGRMHGRARVWGGRLPPPLGVQGKDEKTEEGVKGGEEALIEAQDRAVEAFSGDEAGATKKAGHAPKLPRNSRLEAHVRTLFALTEPGSLDTRNEEEAIAEFEDRLKRAEGKMKVIERITGETGPMVDEASGEASTKGRRGRQGDDSIEDISVLHVRH